MIKIDKNTAIAIIFVFIFIIFLVYPFSKKDSFLINKNLTYSKDYDFGSGKEDLVVEDDKNFKSGTYEYKSILVKKGTISVDNRLGPSKLILKAKEKIVIEKGSKIDMAGKGFKGANYEGATQENSEGNGAGMNFEFAGGGGSHGGGGGSGDCFEENTPQTYGFDNDEESFGSGGSVGLKNKEGEGGSGGGFIELIAPEIIINGEIVVNGENGEKTGGGGSGGKIVILGNRIVLKGKIIANGGDGGNSYIQGAGGGGGGVIFLSSSIEDEKKLEVYRGKGGQALDIYTGCYGKNGDDGVINIFYN